MRAIVVNQWTGTYNKTTRVLIAQQFRAYSIADALAHVEDELNRIVAGVGRFMGIAPDQTQGIGATASRAQDWLLGRFPTPGIQSPKTVIALRALYTNMEDGFQPEELMFVMESLDDIAFLAQAVTVER